MGRSILLVAQLSPPSELSAARRVAGLAKYLDRLGHRITVLTSLSSGRGPVAGARVVRTRDLMVSRLNWRRQSFQALAGGVFGMIAFRPGSTAMWSIVLAGAIFFALVGALVGGMSGLESPDPRTEPSQFEDPARQPPGMTRSERPSDDAPPPR